MLKGSTTYYNCKKHYWIIQVTNKTLNLNFVMQLTSLIRLFIMNTCCRSWESLLCTTIISKLLL